jgi:hypothetical protein
VRDHFRKCAIDAYGARSYQMIVSRFLIGGHVVIVNAYDCERVRRQNFTIDVIVDNMVVAVEFA